MIIELGLIVSFGDLKNKWENGDLDDVLEDINNFKGLQNENLDIPPHRVGFYTTNIGGELFSINLKKNKDTSGYDLSLYDSSGGTAIYSGSIKFLDDWKEAEKHLYNYSHGKIKCHGCGKWVDIHKDINGYCYAGRYCLSNEECDESYRKARKHFTTF